MCQLCVVACWLCVEFGCVWSSAVCGVQKSPLFLQEDEPLRKCVVSGTFSYTQALDDLEVVHALCLSSCLSRNSWQLFFQMVDEEEQILWQVTRSRERMAEICSRNSESVTYGSYIH